MFVPGALLRRLYSYGSLQNTEQGIRFSVKNRLSDAQLTRLRCVRIDGREIPLERVRLEIAGGAARPGGGISEGAPLPFPLRQAIDIVAHDEALPEGEHDIEIAFDATPFGSLTVQVADELCAPAPRPAPPCIPRDPADDYADGIVAERQAFAERFCGVHLHHLRRFSFDPHLARGNCEGLVGAAQVPVGLAGPLRIDGEHAWGEFLVPMATTEGTLIASYNRGIKALNASGGARCTVVTDAMQRAPVFVLPDARAARAFVAWVAENVESIRNAAEETSRVARLLSIDPLQSNRFAFLRFNFSTGDAAGQNMVTRATLAACAWIMEHRSGIERFFLESNVATDKKASAINTMRTRGKRVTAEATIPREVLIRQLRVEPEALVEHYQIANIGAMLAGANNNGLHSANALAALFIATGQDVANVAESSTGIVFAEVTPAGDLYLSITIPSLIVATHGGGTGLATQRECLELLGCHGPGRVRKLAEIVAGVVLAGELSLAAAISSSDWVSSHESLGRNR